MRTIIVALALSACTVQPPLPGPVEPEPAPNPSGCAAACERLRALSCPEGGETPAGATCEDVCHAVEESGLTTLDPACLAEIDSCGEQDACAR